MHRSPRRAAASTEGLGARLRKAAAIAALVATMVLGGIQAAHAAYVLRYDATTRGGVTFTGNTLGLSRNTGSSGLTQPGTRDSIGAFSTIDTTLQHGTYPPGTTDDWQLNSAAAILVLPPASNVLHAELIWGGSIDAGGEDVSGDLDTPVNFTAPGSAPVTVAPDAATAQEGGGYYVRSADVTALVQAAGAGSYVAGGVPGTRGNDNSANATGWTLAVVYGDDSLPVRNMTVFVGAEGQGAPPAQVSGFCTPSSGTINGRVLVTTIEADATNSGDAFRFGPTSTLTNANRLSGPNNPIDNFFASQINDDSGLLDTSGTFGSRNHDAIGEDNVIGGRQGWDITNVDGSSQLGFSQTSAFAQGTTSGDVYRIAGLGLQIDVFAPSFPVVVKEVDHATTFVGDVLTYTVTLQNTGGATADNVIFNDPVPANTSFVAGSFTIDGVAQPGVLTPVGVNLGSIANGAQRVVTFQVQVDSQPADLTIENAAQWDYTYSACGSPIPGTVSTNEVATPFAADVTITKSVADASGNGQAEPGESLTYTITLTNSGGSDALNYGITDPLDPNVAFVSADNGGVEAAGVVTWSGLTVPVGGNLVLTVVVTVDDPVPAGVAEIGNVAYETGTPPPDCDGVPQPVNCIDIPTQANVTIAKSVADASGNGEAEPGEQLTYTITLTNSGGSDATGYGVTDSLDPNVVFVSANNGGAELGGVVTWSGLTVPASGNLVLTVVVTVDDPLPGGVAEIGNVAFETGTPEPDCDVAPQPANCADIPTAASVTIAKTLSAESGTLPGIAEAGEQLTYSITLSNSGGAAALNYPITDALDANVTFVSADNGGTEAGGTVIWTGLTVPAGGNLVLTVVTAVNAPIAPGVTVIGNVAYETGTPPPACPPAGPQCVVVPTAPNVAIGKALTAEDGSIAGQAEPGELLTWQITVINSGGSDALGYGVTDQLDPNVVFANADNGGVHAGGVVTWSGLTVPAGGSVVLTVSANVVDPIPDGVTEIGNVAYETGTPPPACPPTGPQCTVIPTAPDVSVAKSASAPVATGAPAEFEITYTVTASNAGGSAGNYDLGDTLTFNGATVTAITAPVYASSTGDVQDGVPGAFGAPAGGVIVTGEDITAQGSETWTYTVTYAVTDPDIAADCLATNGGLRNLALLGGDAAGAPPAATCTGAPVVAINKTAAAPVPTGNPNEFTLNYTIAVVNTGSLPGIYELSDLLTFNGASVDAVSVPLYGSTTGDVQDGTLGAFVAPGGGVIVSDESIAAGGAETWDYTVTYTITDPGVAQDCADPDGGLRNAAALGGSFSGGSSLCTGAPAVVVGKSVSGPDATGNPDEYELNYLVSVQNNGSLPGLYDLDDAFSFPGTTVLSVSAVMHGGPDPLASPLGVLGPSGGSIVIGESIAAASSETYAYRVIFSIDDPALVGDCAAGGGLVNLAALGGSSAGQVGTCSGVPDVVVVKTASAPAPTGTLNQYTIDYEVTVDNAGFASGRYDLDDTFVFAGATIDAVSAIVHAGPDPLGTAPGTLTAAGGNIVIDEPIAAGSSESYAYTVTFTVTDPDLAGDCADLAGGLRNNAALGGSASGDAATCTGTPNVATVKTLFAEDGLIDGQAEPGEQLTYTITLTNSGGSDAASYGVTDPLDANVAFVSADNGGVEAGGIVTWSGLTVPASGNLVLTVVVTVADPIPAGVTEIGNVAFETGTPEPDCDVVPQPANCFDIPTEANVTTAKTVADASGNGEAEPGEQLTYTITLTNSGGSDATGYGVTDPLDPNVSFVSATNGGVHAAGIVTWTGLTVPAGGSIALTVVVTVDDPIPAGVTEIGNLAHETGGVVPDCDVVPQPANCVDIPSAANVTIAKTVADASGNGEAEPGEQLTYTITLTNSGGSDATNYGVTDPLDPNVVFVSADNGGTEAGGIVTWSGLTVPASGNLVLTVVVTVVDPIPAGVTEIGNVAFETGTPEPDCDVTPQPAGCVDVPSAADVTIAKTVADASGNGEAEPGETLTYTITLTNGGGSDATNYGVTDPLDANVAFVSADNGGTEAGGVVTWSGLTVPASGNLALTVIVTVVDPIPAGVTEIGNVAFETGTPEPDCDVVPQPAGCVDIPTEADVTIAKTVADASGNGIAEPGETLTYTITLANSGGSDATGYGVTDPLDANVAFVSADNGGTEAGGIVTWTGLTVPASGNLVLTVVVTVVDPIPDGVTEIGNVAFETGTPEPDCDVSPQPANCVDIPTGASVTVSKALTGESIDPDGIAQPGEQLTYTLTVWNQGGTAAIGVLVNEWVPANTSFVGGTPTWTCAPGAPGGTACDSVVDVPAFAVGSPGMAALTFIIAVDDPLADGVTSVANAVALDDGTPPDCIALPSQPQCVVVPTVNLSLVKSVVSVDPTGPNTSRVLYRLVVTNTGGSDSVYTLTDTLGFTPDGVVFNGDAQVTTLDGTLNPALPGGVFTPANGVVVQLSDSLVTLPAGTSHTYDLLVPFAVIDNVQNGDCSGGAGNGLYNQAAISGSLDVEGGACAPVNGDQVHIALVKTVALDTDQNGNGLGDVGDVLRYDFEVSNTGSVPLSPVQLFDPRVATLQCQIQTANGRNLRVLHADVDLLFASGFEAFDLGSLDPGDVVDCWATYVLTQTDVDRHRVTNTATTAGAGPNGQIASATSTAIFTAFP